MKSDYSTLNTLYSKHVRSNDVFNITDDMIETYSEKYIKKSKTIGNEAILIIGLPGCGKSTFYTKYYKSKEYTLLDSDEVKDMLSSNFIKKNESEKGNFYSKSSSKIIQRSLDKAINSNIQFCLTFIGYDSYGIDHLISKLKENNYEFKIICIANNSLFSLKSCLQRYHRVGSIIKPSLILEWEKKLSYTLQFILNKEIEVLFYKAVVYNEEEAFIFERINVDEIRLPSESFISLTTLI